MKKIASILMIAAAFAAASCTQEGGKGGKTSSMEFSATAPTVSNLKLAWKANDKIGVFTSDASAALTVAADGSSVTAKGDIAKASQYYAVTPYTGTETCTDGSIITAVPTEQDAVVDGVSYEAAVAVASSSNATLAFKSAVGFVKATIVNGDFIKSITLESNGSENLSGSIKVNAESGKGSVVEGQGTVVLVAEDCLAAGTYYIAAAPATFVDGIEVTLTDLYGRVFSFDTDEFVTVKAGEVLDLGEVDADAEFVTPEYEASPANLAFAGDGETLEATLPVSVKGDITVTKSDWIGNVEASGNTVKVTVPANAPVSYSGRECDDVRYGVVMISANSEEGPFTSTIHVAQAGAGAKLIYDSFAESKLPSAWKGNMTRAGVRLDEEGIHMSGSGDNEQPYALYWMNEQARLMSDAVTCNTIICSVDIKADDNCGGLLMFNHYGYDTDYNYATDYQYYNIFASADVENDDPESRWFFCFNVASANAMDHWEGDISETGWFRLMISNVSWHESAEDQWMGKYIWSLKEDENGVLQKDQLLFDGDGPMWWWNDDPAVGTNYGYFGIFSKDEGEATMRNFTVSYTDKQ